MDIFLADDPKNQYVTCLLSLYYASIKPLSRLLTLYVHIKAIKALLRLYGHVAGGRPAEPVVANCLFTSRGQ
jgi:hypothetical protein